MDVLHPIRIIVWKQYRNTADAPYRRKGDRRFGFHFIHPSGGQQTTWPWVLSQINRHTVRIKTFYSRHERRRVVQVFIGDREFLATYWGKR